MTVLPAANDRSPRIMLYSHDTFGLGHLRRSSALAAAITGAIPEASALIMTGSPVAGRYAFPGRVDHVRLPGVTKRPDGSYESRTIGIPLEETTELRAGLIRTTANRYDPDILIVDKEPTGFRGELLPTLELLRQTGRTSVVLGLRDVLDEPGVLAAEWARKGAVKATEDYYDELWVYGLKTVYDPTAGLDFSADIKRRTHFTGYLHRTLAEPFDVPDRPYVLITPGGGGDGESMVDLVLSAYEQDPGLEPHGLVVYGPFLSGSTREDFEARVARLEGRVSAVGFESRIEALFAGAEGVICMGGYNTFCEVLSFDKRAVIVPRTQPRLEQYIRASRAEELGLIRMLHQPGNRLTIHSMIRAIRELPSQPLPSEALKPGLLDGLDFVATRVASLLKRRSEAAANRTEGHAAE